MGGPVTYNWNFSVANQARPLSGQLQAQAATAASAAEATPDGTALETATAARTPIHNAYRRPLLKR
jgi:hypothetical protein